MNSRYNPRPIDMRYNSPDAIRPNESLVARTQQNFGKRPHPRGPSPSQLPMPSLQLRTSEQAPSLLHRQPSSKITKGKKRNWSIIKRPISAPPRKHSTRQHSLSQQIKGKNRTWKLKPKHSPVQIIKGKNREWTIRNAGKNKTKRKYKRKNKTKFIGKSK